MEEAARTYGVAMKTVVDEAGNETQVLDESLLGLGHAQAKLTDEAGRLAAAWDLLTGEGAHTGAAIRGMTDEAQGFVTQALEMGIALPAAMQPMIEKMIEHGRLTDLKWREAHRPLRVDLRRAAGGEVRHAHREVDGPDRQDRRPRGGD